MKKRSKNKESAHLRRKTELYESFLFRYLPQIGSLSYITRFNIFDAFGPYGTDRSGRQGSPAIVFEAMRKQRQHQLRRKASLKPFSLTLLYPLDPGKTFQNTLENLQLKNAESNTCKLSNWAEPLKQGISKLLQQRQLQPASEKYLLMLDPLGIPQFSFQELLAMAEKKVEVILSLPLADLWQLHTKPEKAQPIAEVRELKPLVDNLFPAEHPYWSPEIEFTDFVNFLKQAFSKEDKLFATLEPAGTDIPETALLGISSDAFMMEKMLQALQALRPEAAPPPGQQLGIFGAAQTPSEKQPSSVDIGELLKEETDNQQLYAKGLKAGMLPAQLLENLQDLLKEGTIEMLDEKRKPVATIPPNCLNYTGFKAAKAVCYFRIKE